MTTCTEWCAERSLCSLRRTPRRSDGQRQNRRTHDTPRRDCFELGAVAVIVAMVAGAEQRGIAEAILEALEAAAEAVELLNR